MKQIFLLLAVVSCVGMLDANAQSCMKSAAARAAALDQSIVQRVSASGEVSYAKKKVCPATGDVTYADVEYCSKTGRFVALAVSNPSSTYKSACNKKMAASCSKYYSSKNAMAITDMPAHCVAAQKAACLQANQKTQTARAAFASLDNRVIKP